MLIKLLPYQVSSHWDLIKDVVEVADPQNRLYSPKRLNNLLKSLLLDGATAWIIAVVNGEVNAKGLIITSFTTDQITDTRSLSIDILGAFNNRIINNKDYVNLYSTLVKYARSKRCKRIVAYTNVPRIIKFATELSIADSNFQFLSFDITRDLTKEDLNKALNLRSDK